MWVTRWRHHVGDRISFAPYQAVADKYPQIGAERFREAAQFIEPDGTVYEGAAAVFRALRCGAMGRLMWWAYRCVPLVGLVCNVVYRFVARHRPFMARATTLFWEDVSEPPRYVLSRAIFLRMLGVVYLIAFLSLGSQVLGLGGEDGVMPVRLVMDWHEQRLGDVSASERLLRVPTLCWFYDSDASLVWQCRAGAVLAGLLIVGVAPVPVLIGLWALYLSLLHGLGVFMSFQWDTLLLEAGFVAVFFAPLGLLMGRKTERAPSRFARWMLWLLLFKLMFLSGVVKLTSGDDTWRDFTALTYHYETQPLAVWTSWYAHQLPLGVHQAVLVLVFAIELVVPFLIFGPRNLRYLAGFSIVFLMLMIGLTGNYNFFNLLTVVLCVPLFDDRFWYGLVPWRRSTRGTAAQLKRDEAAVSTCAVDAGGVTGREANQGAGTVGVGGAGRRVRWVRGTVLCAVLIGYAYVSAVQGVRGSWPRGRDAAPVPEFATSEFAADVLTAVGPFRTINAYGLFRVMTTRRPEIVIEGSADGKEWHAYEFPWKPGDVERRPGFVQPHQPRLDWQMWFAALGHYRSNPWVGSLMRRLREGSPEVLALFSHNPFPDEPPRFVRAVLYQYNFSDFQTRAETGAWWTREKVGLYSPVLGR